MKKKEAPHKDKMKEKSKEMSCKSAKKSKGMKK